MQRKNCFLAAAVCNSVTKRGWFTAASSEDRKVAGARREYEFGHPMAEAVGGAAQSDLQLLQYSVKEGRWWEPCPSSWQCPAVSHKSLV